MCLVRTQQHVQIGWVLPPKSVHPSTPGTAYFEPQDEIAADVFPVLVRAAASLTCALIHDLQSKQRDSLFALLCSWAGLHSPALQASAYAALAQRPPASGSRLHVGRHFQSQLVALAIEYSVRHRDEDAPRQELLHQRARLQRALEGKEDDTHFGMPAKAYTPSSPHSLKGEDEAVALLAATADELDVALDSPVVRDRLLKKAQGVYVASSMDRAARNPLLLPLTEWLHRLHPSHPHILLLLACTYYMLNDFSASLWYNSLLLRIDPTYIEAMNNLGLTLRSLGRWHEAETWWWRTLQQRAYWDGYDHLLESLCGPHQWVEPVVRQVPVDVREALPPLDLVPVQPLLAPHGPRLDEALRLCRQMEKRVITSSVVCPERLAPAHLHRLQHLYYAMGNIKYVLPQEGVAQAVMDYEHSIQVALSYGEDIFTLRDLVVATCLVCILTLGVQFPTAKVHKLAKAFDIDLADPIQEVFVRNGDYASLGPSCVLELVHRAGDSGLQALLEMGDGKLPILYLAPTKAIRLPEILFQSTRGVLPALFHISAGAVAPVYQDKAGGMFSNVLLTVIKVCQTPSPTRFTLGGIETSVGLLLPCFYLAFAMHPSAPTCNNLGILLASLPLGMSVTLSHSPSPVEMSGQQLALWYYRAGLVLDPHHPHLYTSLGSLLKELDQLSDSISMYMRAVECAPNYDVALANLANAVKDQGRTQDSIVYYRRAVAENPEFAAALCGLVNALMAICSWDDVYEGPRLMDRVKAICAQEVHEGSTYGRGVLAATGTLEDWMGRISGSLGLKNDDKPQWREMLGSFFSSTSVSGEGSFLLRLVQRCARDAMRRWYLARLRGEAEATQGSDAYPRLLIPEHLDPPPVPTILPFHTFTYPLTSRQIRIICHRNALRVTWATLTQPWVPRGVYPPPKPPGRIKVAYVSSDFTNHPMAHLMQSVFGMHDAREFEVYCFATSPNDGSPYRARIEAGAEHFEDVAGWDSERLVTRLVDAGIHVLINLHGYTKGARNEIFAARPCPVQVEYMGFAGPMNSSWTDWVIADPVVCPPQTTGPTVARTLGHAHALDPEGDGDWVYSDRFIYLPHSYFVNDHKQGFRDASPDGEAEADSNAETDADGSEAAWEHEEELCYRARRDLFPNLPDDYLIFVNANQLWKMDPDLFSVWLRILQRVPKSILWLLHFPLAGSLHLRAAARRLAGDDVAARIVFTPVAPKDVHIQRGRIADLFLDMAECNAHTTAVDILWSGTPMLTWPRHEYKMCSRVGASCVYATGRGDAMVVSSAQAYEDRAVQLAEGWAFDYLDAEGNVLRASGATDAGAGARALTALDLQADKASQYAAGPPAEMAATVELPLATDPEGESLLDESWVQGVSYAARAAEPPRGAVRRRGRGELAALRRHLFTTRDASALFDTQAWVRALEAGLREAWRRWVAGTDADDSPEFRALARDAPEKVSPHIWVDMAPRAA